MKKTIFSIIASLSFGSFAIHSQTIVINNTTNLDRKGEMVELNTAKLKANFKTKTYILKNDKKQEQPYQLLYNDKKEVESIIFQSDVKANSSATYSLTEGKPAIVKAKTSARFVPERKDDFAWENDMAAYRMYGPALAKENASNGVDFWAKRTSELILDKRYNDELKNKRSYHVDFGDGLDFYKVGHTLGCGGIAPYTADSLWIGNQYSKYKVMENGPLRSVFQLIYDSVKVGTKYYKAEITITVSAGALLNKAVVKYIGAPQKMELAGGIFLHDGKGKLKLNAKNGTAAYAEEAISDAQLPSGRNYVGIYIPTKVNAARKIGTHALVLADYKVGDNFTYYFGGGWNKWGFPTDEDWFNAVKSFSEAISKPLQVTVK
jgi:hypothetical protein